MANKENKTISMKEMLTKRNFEPIDNCIYECNCKIEKRYIVEIDKKDKGVKNGRG